MPKTVILGSARTPIGKMGGGLSTIDATELGGIAIKAALERANVGRGGGRPRDHGPGAAGRPGPDPVAPGADQGRHPQGGLLGDDQQGLRLERARGRDPRRADPRRRRRGRRRRRHGVDVVRAVHAAQGPLRLSHGRRQGARRDGPRRADEPVLRAPDVRRGDGDRRRAGDHPPRPRPLGAAQPRARDRGDRQRPPARGDRRGDRQGPQGRHRRRGRRGAAPRQHAGDARQAARARQQGGLAHGRQLAGRQRRRRRDRRRLRRVGEGQRQGGPRRRSSPRRRPPRTSPTSPARPPTPRSSRSRRPA